MEKPLVAKNLAPRQTPNGFNLGLSVVQNNEKSLHMWQNVIPVWALCVYFNKS